MTVTSKISQPALIGTPEQFSEQLRALRDERGVSIRALARETSIPSATLGGYFSGRHLPSLTQPAMLSDLLRALGVTNEDDLREWREALKRVRRGSSRKPAAANMATPYRGLNPFKEDDSALFFGRESVVDELLAWVEALRDGDQPRMLFLVGSSGSGKSSVLQAGLAPRLRQTAGVAIMVAGTEPLAALRKATEELDGQGKAFNVLIVDQAEEIFSPEVKPVQRARFIDKLADVADPVVVGGPVVVLGLRADFYGAAASEPRLLPALRSSQFLLGAMNLEELREAVVRPAEVVNAEFDPALWELLVRDLLPQPGRVEGYGAGALPLVSHALMAAWQHGTEHRLSVTDYLAAGGLHGAVKQSAEAVLDSFDSQGRNAAQWLFTQLVLVDSDGGMTRRRVEFDSLLHPDPVTDAALDDVIEAFVAGRLLTVGDSTVEISHESLLTAWPRLNDWVLSDLDAARLQSRIAGAARLWSENDHDPDLLLRGAPLLEAQTLASESVTSSRTLAAPEVEFVRASSERFEVEQSTERQRVSRLRTIVAMTTGLAVLALALAGLAWWLVSVADAARDDAQASQLAIAADTVRDRNPAAAAQLALAGYRIAPNLTATSSLLDSTGVATPTRFVGPVGEMHATATSDANLVAASGKDGVTRLWQRDSGGVYTRLPDLPGTELEAPGPIWASEFSSQARVLATADVDDGSSTLQLWDLADPREPVSMGTLQARGSVQSMIFSPDGSQLLVGTSEGVIQRWATQDGFVELSPLEDFDGQVMSLSFDGAGKQLAAGTESGDVVVMTDRGFKIREVVAVPGERSSVNTVALRPDGRALVTGQRNADVRLWTVTDGRPVPAGDPFGEFESWVNAATFSPDGARLAVTSSDMHTKVFDAEDRSLLADLPLPAAGTSVQFVEGGAKLLNSSLGGTARLWSLPTPVVSGFGDTVWTLGIDAENRTLMVAPGEGDGGLHMFEVVGGSPQLRQVLRSKQAGPMDGSAGLSLDGTWVAGGTGAGQVAVWRRQGDRYVEAGVVDSGDAIVQGVAFSADGSRMAVVDSGGQVSVWEVRRGRSPRKIGSSTVEGQALSVALTKDGSRLAVGLSDNTVRLWAVDTAGIDEVATLTGFQNYVYALAFDPSGTRLAAGSLDQSVRLWDIADLTNPRLIAGPLQGPGGGLFGVAWRADGQRLAAGSTDGKVWLWDTSDMKQPLPMATLSGPGKDMMTVVFGPDDEIFGAGVDQSLVSWQTDASAVAADVCTRSGDAINEEEWSRLMPSMDYLPTC